MQRSGNLFRQSQKVAVMVAVFQTRNDRLGSSRKLAVGQISGLADIVNGMGNLRFSPFLNTQFLVSRVAAELQIK